MSIDQIIHSLSLEDQKIIKDMMILFEAIGRDTEEFSLQSGLKCKSGCGACCSTPDIETTVAEVLPLAVHLWSTGEASHVLHTIQTKSNKDTCVFFKPNPLSATQGRCNAYEFRPGLCRLFGFAARRDKYGKLMLMTCKVIKENQPGECQRTQEKLQDEVMKAPLLTAHALAVANIDPVSGQEIMPINQAVRIALEKIGYLLSGKLIN